MAKKFESIMDSIAKHANRTKEELKEFIQQEGKNPHDQGYKTIEQFRTGQQKLNKISEPQQEEPQQEIEQER